MSRLLDNLLIFGRLLRRAGIDVHPGRLLDVVEALGHVEPRRTRRGLSRVPRAARPSPRTDRDLRPRLRRLLARAPRATRRDARRGLASRARPRSRSRTSSRCDDVSADADGATSRTTTRRRRQDGLKTWSDLGGLADKDFAAFTTDEIAEAARRPVPSRLESWRTPDAAVGSRPRAASRSSARDRRQPPHRRRRGEAQAADAARAPPRRSCCCATSADRWSATPACSCTSPTP